MLHIISTQTHNNHWVVGKLNKAYNYIKLIDLLREFKKNICIENSKYLGQDLISCIQKLKTLKDIYCQMSMSLSLLINNFSLPQPDYIIRHSKFQLFHDQQILTLGTHYQSYVFSLFQFLTKLPEKQIPTFSRNQNKYKNQLSN